MMENQSQKMSIPNLAGSSWNNLSQACAYLQAQLNPISAYPYTTKIFTSRMLNGQMVYSTTSEIQPELLHASPISTPYLDDGTDPEKEPHPQPLHYRDEEDFKMECLANNMANFVLDDGPESEVGIGSSEPSKNLKWFESYIMHFSRVHNVSPRSALINTIYAEELQDIHEEMMMELVTNWPTISNIVGSSAPPSPNCDTLANLMQEVFGDKNVTSPIPVEYQTPSPSPCPSLTPVNVNFSPFRFGQMQLPTGILLSPSPYGFPPNFYVQNLPPLLPLPFQFQSQQSPNFDAQLRKKGCCPFCRQNGEDEIIFKSHNLYQPGTRKVICPVLRRHRCELCGASGDFAHTRTYCTLYTVGNAPNQCRK